MVKIKRRQKTKETNHRKIIEDFEIFRKTKKKSVINKYKEEELSEIISEHRFNHAQFPWFKAIEKRLKELQPK